jgi:diaminopimelate epimerase
MSEIILRKYHGLGNDYLVYDPVVNNARLDEKRIVKLCTRNIGVGSDGILYGPFFDGKKITLRIFNPDGSEAERSGNGIRIFSRYLRDMGYVSEKKFELTTKSGAAGVTYIDDEGSILKVDMGCAEFGAHNIPAVGLGDEIVGEAIFFCDNFYNATCVSMGNPNCVILIEEVSEKAAKKLGPYVENSKYFPNRINMQLCHVRDENNIDVEIYERGAGYTTASGTGACAAAAAMRRQGLVSDTVNVNMNGGSLLVEFAKNGHIFLTGPVAYVGKIIVEENFFA